MQCNGGIGVCMQCKGVRECACNAMGYGSMYAMGDM